MSAHWRRTRAQTPAVALACALALTTLWWIDALWSAMPADPHLLVYGTCLALAGGAVTGACASLIYTFTDMLPRWLRWSLWPSAAIAAGVGLAIRLGALSRLKGHYSTTAWTVLSGTAIVGLVMGLLIAWAQEHARQDHQRRSTVARLGLGFSLLISAGAMCYVDRVMYVGLYPDPHNALGAGSILALALGMLLCARPLRLRTIGLHEATLLALIGSVPLWATLRAEDNQFHAFGQRPWSLALLRSVRAVLDMDRDGASALLGGGDCNDANAHVHPLAREIPDNGIDDNCFFGDAHRRAMLVDNTPVPKDASPLNVVLITVDTLTYNRIGSYDARYGRMGRNTMPNLDAWSRRATIFRQAYAAGGWTSISLATLMRGVYARKLHWSRFHETSRFRLIPTKVEPRLAADETLTKIFPLAWQDPHRPLAAWLKRRGMRTHAVVDDGFSSMLSASLGCNEGFDRYEEIDQQPTHRRNDAGTADLAIAALKAAHKGGKPFFLWTHFFGPHTPNENHRRVRLYGDAIPDLYDHEVRFLDNELGRLLTALHRLRKNTAVFITADHGEAFGKGYRSHGFDLTESMIRVPLIARVPGWPRGSVNAPVGLIDLMPTILEITRTPAPTWLDGISLARFALDRRHAPARTFYTDTWQYSRKGEPFTDLVAAFDGTHKVVLNRIDQTMATYVQRGTPDARPTAAPTAEHELTTQLRAYLEETGGTLQIAP